MFTTWLHVALGADGAVGVPVPSSVVGVHGL